MLQLGGIPSGISDAERTSAELLLNEIKRFAYLPPLLL